MPIGDSIITSWWRAGDQVHQMIADARMEKAQKMASQIQNVAMAEKMRSMIQRESMSKALESDPKLRESFVSQFPDNLRPFANRALDYRDWETLEKLPKVPMAQPKEVNVENSLETFLARKYPGYYKDPSVREKAHADYADPQKSIASEFDEWEGIRAKNKAVPLYQVLQTDKGFVPYNQRTGTTRGEPFKAPGGEPIHKPLSATEVDEIATLDSVLQSVNKAKQLYKKDYVGPVAGRYGGLTGMTGLGISREEQKFRASNAEIEKTLFDIGGKQLTTYEMAVLKPFIPKVNDPPDTWEMKIANFEDKYRDILAKKTARFKESGYGVGGNAPDSGVPFFDKPIGKVGGKRPTLDEIFRGQ